MMNPFTQLHEATAEYAPSDPEFLLLEAARALIASPEFQRAELEQAARKALGLNHHWTVIRERGDAAPRRFVATQNSILVGEKWKP